MRPDAFADNLVIVNRLPFECVIVKIMVYGLIQLNAPFNNREKFGRLGNPVTAITAGIRPDRFKISVEQPSVHRLKIKASEFKRIPGKRIEEMQSQEAKNQQCTNGVRYFGNINRKRCCIGR